MRDVLEAIAEAGQAERNAIADRRPHALWRYAATSRCRIVSKAAFRCWWWAPLLSVSCATMSAPSTASRRLAMEPDHARTIYRDAQARGQGERRALRFSPRAGPRLQRIVADRAARRRRQLVGPRSPSKRRTAWELLREAWQDPFPCTLHGGDRRPVACDATRGARRGSALSDAGRQPDARNQDVAAGRPAEVWAQVSRAFNLIAYYDGSVVAVYAGDQIESRTISVPPGRANDLAASVAQAGIADSTNRVRPSGQATALATGVPRFLDQVQQIAGAMPSGSYGARPDTALSSPRARCRGPPIRAL
ncbi:hypothetical protein DdX_21870 [Ditylenchus destructor]|uniref:Uncharacterized protein n=1 Tax=Ditylenchus destructor TaxID=166010 RepID=A0AAD4MED9_9BILA|nr:hypothetical protein DdX_21870 [Ditylenchus destructor]